MGTPTYAFDLAEAIYEVIEQEQYNGNEGIYHYSNEGVCSWFDFAAEIVRMTNPDCRVSPIPTSAYPTKAKRPAYSVLSLRSLDAYGIKPRHWKEALFSPL